MTSHIQIGPESHQPPATPASRLLRYRRWADLPEEARRALLDLIAEPYLLMGFGSKANFAALHGVPPDGPAFTAAWEAALADRKASHRTAYGDDDIITAICARRPSGGLVGLATILTVYGTRDISLHEAIGDPESDLSTLRMLAFECDGGADSLDPAIPERRLAEVARLVVLQEEDLLPLVADGTLSREDMAYILRHVFNEMFATPVWRDRERPDAPLAYLGNTRMGILDALDRRRIDLRRLYKAAGVTPTPRVIGHGDSTSHYFNWRQRLERSVRPVVPGEILALGLPETIRWLDRQDGVDWGALQISLPFAIARTPKTLAAVEALLRPRGQR